MSLNEAYISYHRLAFGRGLGWWTGIGAQISVSLMYACVPVQSASFGTSQ